MPISQLKGHIGRVVHIEDILNDGYPLLANVASRSCSQTLFQCLLKLVVTMFSTFVPLSLNVQFVNDDECFLLTLFINKLELIVL